MKTHGRSPRGIALHAIFMVLAWQVVLMRDWGVIEASISLFGWTQNPCLGTCAHLGGARCRQMYVCVCVFVFVHVHVYVFVYVHV